MALPINYTNPTNQAKTQESRYLDGIRRRDSKILNEIYDKFLPSVTQFILKNSGSEDDAYDIFQDGLMVIFKKLKNQELEITSGFHAYLFGVCRFIWLRELEKKRRKNIPLDDSVPYIADVDLEKDIVNSEKERFFRSKLEDLPTDSKQVLKMFFDKMSFREIGAKMNYTEDYAKKKKYKAQKLLISLIKKDIRFKEFANQYPEILVS